MGIRCSDYFSSFPAAVEASNLNINELSIATMRINGSNGFADVLLQGRKLYMKIRGAAVTVAPHTNEYNTYKMDVKLPEDQQGTNLRLFDAALSATGNYPNLSTVDAIVNNENSVEIRSFLYGTFFDVIITVFCNNLHSFRLRRYW